MVLEADKKDHDDWLIEHSELDGDELIVCSEPIRLEHEWRFFIIDGKVICGSTYKRFGVRNRNFPVPESVWEIAREKASGWLPSPNIVMDICETRDGEYKVIEFNCINASGAYNSDVGKLIDVLEEKYNVL